MPDDQPMELDSLSFDDAHKLGNRFAAEVTNTRGELVYDSPVSIEVEGIGTYTLTIEYDPEAGLFDGNHGEWGELAESSWHRNTGRQQRPSGFDGAARILSTRGGPVWWQPPAGEKANAQLAERVRRFLAEDWSFVGVTLTLSIPGYDDQSTSLWGIESDPGADYLAEVISEMSGELEDAPGLERQTLATKLRRWADVFEAATHEVPLHGGAEAVAEMLAMANTLDPKPVQTHGHGRYFLKDDPA